MASIDTQRAGQAREAYSYRADPAVAAFPDDRPIIVFDGYCAFCSTWARFVLWADRQGKFRLLPAQTPLGHALYVHYGLNPDDYESNILVADGGIWLKSEGTIRVAEGLGLPWSFAAAFRILPLAIRDRAYEFIARNRFRILGRRESCMRPEARYKDRFLA